MYNLNGYYYICVVQYIIYSIQPFEILCKYYSSCLPSHLYQLAYYDFVHVEPHNFFFTEYMKRKKVINVDKMVIYSQQPKIVTNILNYVPLLTKLKISIWFTNKIIPLQGSPKVIYLHSGILFYILYKNQHRPLFTYVTLLSWF